jgi:hypothetical protein
VKLELEPLDDAGSLLRAVYVERTYRFLLSGGATVDVIAHTDNSTLREAVLRITKAERIEGVTEVRA